MTTCRRLCAASRCALTVLAAAAVSTTASVVLAQQPPLALDRFEPSPTGDRFFGVASPYPGEHLMPHFGVVLDYAHDPLVLVREQGDDREDIGSVVEHQLHLHVGASFSLFDYVSVNLSMPFALYQAGDSPEGGGVGLASPDGAGIGDLRIGAKVRFYGDFDDPFQIGVGGFVWAPTGDSASGSFTSDGEVRGMPYLALGGKVDWFLYTLTAGPELRPSQRIVATTQGTMMHWGLGLAAVLGDDEQWQIGPELSVATVFDELNSSNTNAEALFGAKWRFVDFMEMGLAVGPGISEGVGTPDFRGVFSLAFTPKPEHDRDDDGIKDGADVCPDQPGPESADPQKNGCPGEADRDGDGIVDSQDACVDQPGMPNADPKLHGCPPDRDGDGILDAVDACPDQKGVASDDPKKNGCPPDRDGDGIFDDVDACPEQPGVASDDPKKNGCPPDRDGDGILDAQDACPDQPGKANADPKKNGCPLPADRDGDGILDAQDACPDQPGKADPDPKKNGCPTVVVGAGDIMILQKILFDTDRDTIKPVSNTIIDDVAGVLKSHSELTKIEIQGHTDSQGGAAHNQDLSQRRANAVKAALVKRGIAADRLAAKGFGLSVPVADNNTPEGRETNRRVEFKILERSKAAKPAP